MISCYNCRYSLIICLDFVIDWSYDAYKAMLDFFYTGSVTHFESNLALDLLGLVDHYTIPALKGLCENTLILHVDVDNACSLLSCGHRFQVSPLPINYVKRLIFIHFNALH